jgi:hypothetical protein
MPTQFEDLPAELRLQIFELAAAAEWTHRVVEIFFKAGEIYSKTPPPPLLCVNRESRHVILKYYKPWLPQFRGTAAYQPWTQIVEESRLKKLSRLQNVCISLEHDVLLIAERQWSLWNFGPLERDHLRSMALNVGGWLNWEESIQMLRRFTHLYSLRGFDAENSANTGYLAGVIVDGLAKEEATSQEKPGKKGSVYVSPITTCEAITTKHSEDPQNWIRYKYPRLVRCHLTTTVKLTSISSRHSTSR